MALEMSALRVRWGSSGTAEDLRDCRAGTPAFMGDLTLVCLFLDALCGVCGFAMVLRGVKAALLAAFLGGVSWETPFGPIFP